MDSYRYGFQNQEKDDELKGAGNSVNYTYRMHDPRIGRFFAVDPLASKYPQWSPYVFSGNQVVHMVELEGLEPSNPKLKGTGISIIIGGLSTAVLQGVMDAGAIDGWINGDHGLNFHVGAFTGVGAGIGSFVGMVMGGIPGLFIGAAAGSILSIGIQKVFGMSTNAIIDSRIKRNLPEWNSLNSTIENNQQRINENNKKITELVQGGIISEESIGFKKDLLNDEISRKELYQSEYYSKESGFPEGYTSEILKKMDDNINNLNIEIQKLETASKLVEENNVLNKGIKIAENRKVEIKYTKKSEQN
jgi:RHS repeat-associated protein